MPELGAWSQREIVVINALRIIAHTKSVDEEFMQQCIDMAAQMRDQPGFAGGMLEQHMDEFNGLLTHAKGCTSALEIGSRYGKSLIGIASQLAPNSRVVSIDLGINDAPGRMPDIVPVLKESMQEIASQGHSVNLFLGNSRSQQIVEAVKALGPFEFVFIDGDHTYEGVKADWENYGPMGTKVVAFHDIINNADCARLWREIKAQGYRTVEYTSSVWLGIGVVLKQDN